MGEGRAGRAAPDEVSVLRDARWLGRQGTDLCPVGADLAVARGLEAAGMLEISVTGRLLGKACYRVAAAHAALASECERVVEAEREGPRRRIADGVGGALFALD